MARDFITDLHVTEDEISNLLSELPEDDPTAASDFFTRFNFGPLFHNNRFFEALERGHEILHLCARLNPDVYLKMHKGYPFYWMGMAAYRIHDFQSAIYYIDATLSEDLKNFPSNSDTPPSLFLRLEGGDERQAARYIVQGAQKTIEEYIKLFNDVHEKNNSETSLLNIEDVRSGLLSPAVSSDSPDIRSLASTFITFFLEFKYRDFQLSLRPEPGTNEPFFIHLLKGCLLFESLLKNNLKIPTKSKTLKLVLNDLSNEFPLPDKFSIKANSIQEVLQEAVNAEDHVISSIIVTGKLRNTLSHNVGWPSQISRDQYIDSFLHIAISCLYAISVLYL